MPNRPISESAPGKIPALFYVCSALRLTWLADRFQPKIQKLATENVECEQNRGPSRAKKLAKYIFYIHK